MRATPNKHVVRAALEKAVPRQTPTAASPALRRIGGAVGTVGGFALTKWLQHLLNPAARAVPTFHVSDWAPPADSTNSANAARNTVPAATSGPWRPPADFNY